ncbi:MAG: SpoIID/LytB domain-containing protein [Actinomycetota bacterium]|nr:SpoIID/LytB domain-containing protein [Actinomycetota bacterium]
MSLAHSRRARVLERSLTVFAVAAAATAVAVTVPTSARAVEIYPLPLAGSLKVAGHGNGHGHGMSQYGARGAAMAGHPASYIVSFYYPNTSLATLSPSLRIRVNLPSAGTDTCIAAKAGLSATGVGAVPVAAGVRRLRLIPSGSGLALQQGTAASCAGAGWSTIRAGLPAQVDFSSTQNYVQLYLSDGTSTVYRGTIGAVRSGSGELTINRVGLDDYAMGVAPREMPASWQSEAVHAQAIAARSYGEFEREHAGGQLYDICDTDQCQVYGGMTHYDSAGNVLWQDYPPAVTGNSNQVIQYRATTAFTQFSASDGGWTADGGQPYLIAQADPFDNAGTGDPYLNWTYNVSAAQIAGYYGLSRARDIVITSRDGHGDWGGRVLGGYVDGVNSSGTSVRVTTTGVGLQNAMGLPTDWFHPAANAMPIGHVDVLSLSGPGIALLAGWTLDPDHKDRSGVYYISVDGHNQSSQNTTVNRPDVQRVYHLVSPVVGFSTQVRVSVGSHSLCVFGVDQDGGGSQVVGCQSIYMPDPIGHLDTVTTNGASAQLAGWTFDPDHTSNPGQYQVTVDGAAPGAVRSTSVGRPDVQRAYHTPGDVFGFSVTLTPSPPGVHTICILGVDQDGHGSVPIQCAAMRT